MDPNITFQPWINRWVDRRRKTEFKPVKHLLKSVFMVQPASGEAGKDTRMYTYTCTQNPKYTLFVKSKRSPECLLDFVSHMLDNDILANSNSRSHITFFRTNDLGKGMNNLFIRYGFIVPLLTF